MHTASFYYAVLLWAAILYGAGVAFKFGSLFLYAAFMPWVSDSPIKPRPKPQLPKMAAVLWWWLGTYLILAGIAQIPPLVALMHPDQWAHLPAMAAQRGIGHTLTQAWLRGLGLHPIMYNILVFMIEAVLGLFLLTERGTALGRITAVVSGLWGLFVWIFPEGLGYLASSRDSWWVGAPGTGLLLAGLSFLLVLPPSRWTPRLAHYLRQAWLTLWGVGTLFQLRFFAPGRLQQLFAPTPHLPAPSFLEAPITGLHHLAVVHPWDLNLGIVLLTAAVGALGLKSSASMARVGVLVILLVQWWLGQNLGLNAQFALMLNSAPLWAAWWYALG